MMSRLRPFRQKGILEVPVTADYSFRLNDMAVDKSIKQALGDFELVRSQGGVFVLNNHPNKVNLEVLFAFLRSLILKLSCKSDFIRLKDVARSCQQF